MPGESDIDSPKVKHMGDASSDKVFAGSIPVLYEQYLVPLIFEPYAADLAGRLASRSLERVLEIAAGTGVVTRRLASVLPDSVAIVATDLNPPMLAMASEIGTRRPVEWRQGTPLRNEIESRDASRLGEATDIAAEAVARKFGRAAVDGKIQAHIVEIEK